jgi:hypothetical protein
MLYRSHATADDSGGQRMIMSWAEVKEFYQSLADQHPRLSPMLRLVEAVESSRYASGLYPWTSMADLCVQQVPSGKPYDGPFLRISPRSDSTVEFRYIDTGVESRQWHRVVEADHAFARLERFIEQLHWFPRLKPRHDA